MTQNFPSQQSHINSYIIIESSKLLLSTITVMESAKLHSNKINKM